MVQLIHILLQAGIIAAGIDGIENNRNPGKPSFLNMYAEAHKAKMQKNCLRI